MSQTKVALNPFARMSRSLVLIALVAGLAGTLVEPRLGLLAAALVFGWTQLGTI